MAEWLVRLKGRQSDLEALDDLSLAGYTVTQENRDYYLGSSQFDSLRQADAVRECANAFLEQVRADAAVHELAAFQSVGIDVVTNVRGDGVREQSLSFTADAFIVAPKDQRSRQSAGIESLFALAQRDARVADALHFFDKPNWANLYKVFELVSEDVGGEREIAERDWASKRTIKRFKRTAQSRAAIGDEARHAKTSFTPPSNPMALSAALTFIRALLLGWSASK